nr:restriction endonuclease subunit S [Pacificimonas pallii]
MPEGWTEATLREVTHPIETDDPTKRPQDTFHYVNIGSIDNTCFQITDPKEIIGRDAPSRARRKIKTNDVLFSTVRPYLKNIAQVPDHLDGEFTSTGICILRANEAVESGYLLRRVISPDFIDQMTQASDGTMYPAIADKDVFGGGIAIPPLAEQRRIVAKLDALTARLTRARKELDRVPLLAERMRQAAVKDAFAGALTTKWREHNPGHSAASLDDTAEAYISVAGVKRRKPTAGIDWKPEIELPEGWRWASVDELIAAAQYGSSSKTSHDDSGVPVLRMGNIQRGELDWTNLKFLPSDHSEFPGLFLDEDDVLFNRTNSFELVGKSAVFRGRERPASYASYLIRLKCSAILPDLLARYINSPYGRAWIDKVASQQVGQANVNGTKLKALGIPLAPAEEQEEILRIVDNAFARADRLEVEAAKARALLDRMEAAILARAFRGELVPQDPADEPAGILLDRIRAERAAAPKPKRGRRKKADA